MSAEEGSLREIWAALSQITRRLDELAAAITRLNPTGGAPAVSGETLDEPTRARLARMESVLAIGPGIVLGDALLLAVDRLVHQAGADCAAVFLLTPDGRLNTAAQRGFATHSPEVQPDEGIVGRALAEGESIRGGTTHRDRDPLMREHALGQALAVPIGRATEPARGVVFAGRRRAVEFDSAALEVAMLVADRLQLLLARSPAGGESAGVLSVMADLDLERTAAAVAREAALVLSAPAVAVLLPEDGGLALAAGVGIPRGANRLDPGTGVIANALRTREPWTPAKGGGDDALGRFLGAPPQLVIPLVAGDNVVALLAAGGLHRIAPGALGPLLPHAAAAIRHARLYTEMADALAELRATEGQLAPAAPPARDLGGLLAVILGRLAVVREHVANASVVRDLDVAEEAAWRAAEAVRALLGFAPGHRIGALTPLDLAAVIRVTVEHARSRWAARGAAPPPVQLDIDPLPPIRGSADDLREAFDHLLENAAEAVPDGSLIAVRARWDGGARVEVVVEDHGAGMDDDVQVRALEPFFSTKGAGRLGLGLPVAQAIVARHRGDLEIASAPGLGTTVRVTFPTMASRRRGGAGTALPVVRVLVVEDEALVRETLTTALVRQGHAALTAADPQEALATVQEQQIDVVITDLALPGGSGLEVARAVKRARPGTPVILVTAWPGRLEADRLEESGVDAVIEKPVGLEEIRTALADVLARRGARRA